MTYQKLNSGFIRKRHSEESKKKMSISHVGKHHSEEAKEKIGKFRMGKHHTEEAKEKISKHHNLKSNLNLIIGGMRGHIPWNKGLKGFLGGEKHYNWKGGITEENTKIRQSLEYIIWRNEVYKRDNYSCRLCGKKCKGKDIVAHHIKLFSNFPELRFSIDNGITLCRSCHKKIHFEIGIKTRFQKLK